MAYNATYDQGDFQDIVIDGFGVFGASIVEWLELIVLIIILVYLMRQGKQLTKAVR